jgi:flavin reductase (DIM6/NTAB) family NADH-FMN oxidoreductase RutF
MKKIEVPFSESSLLHPGYAIYLISTVSKDKIYNIAPYGMVISISYSPLTYLVASDKDRDTYRNILDTGEFVINIPSTKLLKKVDITGEKFPKEVDEFKVANLTPIPSLKVKPPRILECRGHIECRSKKIIEINKKEVIIIAKAVSLSIDKNLYLKNYKRQKRELDPLFAVRPNQGKVPYFKLGKFLTKL